MEDQNSNRPLYPYTSALRLTLKAWPVITAATVGLCYLTQTVAKWFGIELPDQANIELVKRYAGWNRTFILLCAQVIILMPAIEELIFRYLLFKLPLRILHKRGGGTPPPQTFILTSGRGRLAPVALAIGSSALFSAAHYLAQPFPDSAFIALFFFGLAQCWLYHKTSRLWCAVLNHALFNLTNLVLLFVLPEA